MKKIILGILIIVWGSLIFWASDKTSTESNKQSQKVIYETTKSVVDITSKITQNTSKHDEKWYQNIAKKWNYPVRKIVHGLEYLILGVLIFFFIYKNNIKKAIIISILCCLLYSISDEYHQTFIKNRTGQINDCYIDILGATLGISMCSIISYKKRRKDI